MIVHQGAIWEAYTIGSNAHTCQAGFSRDYCTPCFYIYMYETEIQQIDINYEFPKN